MWHKLVYLSKQQTQDDITLNLTRYFRLIQFIYSRHSHRFTFSTSGFVPDFFQNFLTPDASFWQCGTNFTLAKRKDVHKYPTLCHKELICSHWSQWDVSSDQTESSWLDLTCCWGQRSNMKPVTWMPGVVDQQGVNTWISRLWRVRAAPPVRQ